MAYQVYPFQVTIPAGTAKSAPVTTALPMPIATIERIRWRVPVGARGTVGWQLAMGGLQVIPTGIGSYIVANDEADDWDLSGLPDSGAWQLIGYNTGNFDHSVYLYFFATPVQLLTSGSSGIPTLLPASALSS